MYSIFFTISKYTFKKLLIFCNTGSNLGLKGINNPMSAKVPTAVPDPRSPSQWPGLNGKVSWLSGPEGQFLIFSGDRWKRMGRGTVVKNGLHPLSTH